MKFGYARVSTSDQDDKANRIAASVSPEQTLEQPQRNGTSSAYWILVKVAANGGSPPKVQKGDDRFGLGAVVRRALHQGLVWAATYHSAAL